MNSRKYSVFLNRFWFLMAVYFLNISVDYQDIKGNKDIEKTPFNEQESIIELVVEKALGFENAISEHETDDTDENNTFKKNFSLDKFILSNPFALKNNFILATKKAESYHKCNYYKTCLVIHSPPPEISFL